MKKAFTLIELLVAISLFMLIMVFLYKTFDFTASNNKFFEKKVEEKISFNQIKKIILEDLIEGKILEIKSDKNSNTVLLLETENSYHNVFYKYVTYFISNENSLLRIESFYNFEINKLNDNFFDKAYIDIIDTNMKRFRLDTLKDNDKAYSILLESNSGELDIFTSLQLWEI